MKPAPYGPFPYSPIIRRPPLRWPGGARVALWIIPNIEFFALDEPIPAGTGGAGSGPKIPDVSTWATRDYGNRVGVFRIMEVLDRYDIRATVALNSNICAQHPAVIEEGQKRRWEWMGHGETNSRRLNEIESAEEPGVIASCLATIERATGTKPKGWLGSGLHETWNTVDLLSEAGVEYVCDWVNDDEPYLMTSQNGRHLLSVPYSVDLNDKPAYERQHLTANEFREMICQYFDTVYREGARSGRVLAIAVHPYLTGKPQRIGALDAALDYICRHDGVWLTTGTEIAKHYMSEIAT